MRWIHGDATALPAAGGRSGDDDRQRGSGDRRRARSGTERCAACTTPCARADTSCSRPATRAYEAWREWTRAASYEISEIDGVGAVENWAELTAVNLPLVTFRWTFVFPDGDVLTSDSTLALSRARRGPGRAGSARLRRGRRSRRARSPRSRARVLRTPSGVIRRFVLLSTPALERSRRSARRSRTCGRGRARRACAGTTSSSASGPSSTLKRTSSTPRPRPRCSSRT